MSTKIKLNLKTKSVFEVDLNSYRNIIKDKLSNTTLSIENINKLENSIYNYTQKDYLNRNFTKNSKLIDLYMDISRHVIDNLIPDNHIGNNYLITAIENGEIDIESVPELPSQSMYPKLWESYTKKLHQKIIDATKDLEPNSTLYTCSKCGNKKTHTEQKQLRSQDEPMTIIIKCCISGCNNKWRIN